MARAVLEVEAYVEAVVGREGHIVRVLVDESGLFYIRVLHGAGLCK